MKKIKRMLDRGPVYIICKLITWFVPVIMLMYATNQYREDLMVVVFVYIVHFAMKYRAWLNGKGRMSYEIWVFVAMLWAIYCGVVSFIAPEKSYMGEWEIIDIIIPILAILVIVSKIYVLYMQTGEYNEGAEERAETRIRSREIHLDSNVESATRMIENARTPQERRQAEMELERAKIRRDSYYKRKNRK